jgi:hypothetical protein
MQFYLDSVEEKQASLVSKEELKRGFEVVQ